MKEKIKKKQGLIAKIMVAVFVSVFVLSAPVKSYATDYYNEYGYWFRTVNAGVDKWRTALTVKTSHEIKSMQYYCEWLEFASSSSSNMYYEQLGFSVANSDWIPFFVNGYNQGNDSCKNDAYDMWIYFYNVKDGRILSTYNSNYGGVNKDCYASTLTSYLGHTELLKAQYNSSVSEENAAYGKYYSDFSTSGDGFNFGLNPTTLVSCTYTGSAYCKGALIETNISMFNNTKEAIAFYQGTSSVGPVNQSMITSINTITYDTTIEAPQNFRAMYNSAGPEDSIFDITLKWDQSATVSNRKTEVYTISQGNFYLMSLIGKKSHITEFKTGMMFDKSVDSPAVGNECKPSAIITLMDSQGYRSDKFEPWKTVNSADSILTHIQQEDLHYYFYIRNVIGNKSSDWVMVHLDLKNLPETDIVVSSPIGGSYSVGGTSQVSGGVTQVIDGNATSGDISAGSAHVKDSYEIQGTTVQGGGSSNPTGSNITDNIKNGFGLIGEGGIISLFQSIFSFIPPIYFTILTTGISTCMAIAVIKFVRG